MPPELQRAAFSHESKCPDKRNAALALLRAKKIPAKAGIVRGKICQKIDRSVQSGPAHKLDSAFLQVEILCQHGLDVVNVGISVHWAAQFHHPTEFIAAAILRVSQQELRVVLGGHGLKITPVPAVDL
jgi:hypothetical protein